MKRFLTAIILTLFSSSAFAAVTVEDAYAFAGLVSIEAPFTAPPASVSLSSTVAVPTGAGDDVHLLINATSGATGYNTWPLSTPDNGVTWVHIAAWVAISNPDLVVDTSVDLITFGPNDGVNIDVGIRITSVGTGTEHSVHILRQTGTISSTDADLFEDDTWYWLELFYKRHDTTGTCSFYLTPAGDDSRNLIRTVSGTDFNDGSGAGGHAVVMSGQVDASAPFGGSSGFRWKNLIIEYGIATMPTDGQFRVASLISAAYQSGTTSDTGDNLVSGDWIDTIDSLLATKGVLLPSDAGGVVADSATGNGIIGPKDQFGSAAVAIGAKWSGAFREFGTASTGIFYGNYDGSSYTTNSALFVCVNICVLSVFEAAGGSYIPDIDDEWFVIGGDNGNPVIGDFWLRELRTFMFSSFPYDAVAVSLIDRVPFGASQRAERVGG